MWQWVRCPMGICNAPATFQRAMNVTFQNFVNKTRLTQRMINFCVIVYMDDILVYSKSYHRHAQHIKWTLGELRDAGFKIALEKSEFFLSKISFLGYVVTRGGLRPDSRKVATVRDAPVPTSLTQVRAFLELTSYYHLFIKGFLVIARPLMNLLRKDQPLSWDAECKRGFITLKEVLATTPILIRPDPAKQFILITNWQPEAISAILAQMRNDSREHVIEYASRTVPDERRNDSAPQRECYAVVWGIQHFHPYLCGQKFLLVTDHEPLLVLKRLTNYTGMIGRWTVRLQEYDFDIIHRKIERHGNADGLIRLHRPTKVAKGEEIIPWKEPEPMSGPRYEQVAVLPRDKKQAWVTERRKVARADVAAVRSSEEEEDKAKEEGEEGEEDEEVVDDTEVEKEEDEEREEGGEEDSNMAEEEVEDHEEVVRVDEVEEKDGEDEEEEEKEEGEEQDAERRRTMTRREEEEDKEEEDDEEEEEEEVDLEEEDEKEEADDEEEEEVGEEVDEVEEEEHEEEVEEVDEAEEEEEDEEDEVEGLEGE
ncbi:hypothetical protein CBR_g78805 [Chara braunii]|uniref:Reverse transcriptase domain-containing protein n=1 Tax=Chara braunii TaxID=69332 RepID=A0A388KAI3_CHABU|nr:hypothetical protein CBR_g78805 [Chara braunii]|eukprot:GBG67026.1 hypothetical protein CBR_g78805 [Chara braunii]